MRSLLIAAGADPMLRAYCTIGDLDWWRSIHADPKHVRQTPLWFVDGELAGFIWPSDNDADLLVHPAHRGLEPAMPAWAEANLAAAGIDRNLIRSSSRRMVRPPHFASSGTMK
jgi:hypothetical protein